MSVGDFLADENFGSWADEMDEFPLPVPEPRSGYGGERRMMSGYGNDMGGFERDHRGYAIREELPMPTQPPYTAHIGNLSFEATQGDIADLFAECEVTNVRVVEDKITRAPKGFGYVEFATVEGLKKALTFQGTPLQGRNIRVSVAEPPKERQDTRDYSDWSRKGPLPDVPSQRRVSDRPGFGSRGQDSMSDAGGDRPGRRAFEPADGKVRDYGNWERKGPLSPSLASASLAREGGRPRSKDGPQFRRASPAWGEARSQDGSRPPRREFHERPPPERAPTAPELDNQWRARMRPDPVPKPAPSVSEAAPAAAPPAPAQRPKLNLQKRTVEAEPASPTAPTGDSKSSPFGGARPIDTSAREREVEERRQLALRQKREAEEKAKAEKAEKLKAAKEQEQQAKEQAAKAESVDATVANGAKEDDSGAAPAGKNIEILRRAEEPPVAEGSAEAGAADEKSEAPKEQAKEQPKEPKEPTRQQAPSKANGNWRNGASRSRGPSHGNAPPRGPQSQARGQQPKAPAGEPTASTTPAEPEEEGWSTVSSKPRNSRRGNHTRG
ncbi:translation initiation factor 4B [Blastomyces parvus]|uniref:Translation initiation factor 4B n=1 Tax=Blastomyces parvus TaxID=2060905 RepID=A0A2B7X4F6_9EURO|nr:translation initiation factor 4B [Blastomyces parvus]